MEQVNIDHYFDTKTWDSQFIKFLTFPLGKRNRDDNLIFVLNKIKDNRILELYNVTMELKNIYLPGYDKSKNLKRRGRKKVTNTNNPPAQEKIIESIENQIRLMIRLMERDDTMTWLIYPLYSLARQLYGFINIECNHETAYMERCIRNIHKCLTMCLNDRNPNERENKRCCVLYFINLEFKIYKQLGNRDMIKNLIKVYESRGDIQTTTKNKKYPVGKAQLVTFHYYMGLYYGCYENDHLRGITNLKLALAQCSIKFSNQIKHILKLLIPLQLLVNGEIINPDYVTRFNINGMMPRYYHTLILLITQGKLSEYNEAINNNIPLQAFILKDETFVIWQLLIHRVQINYVKNKWRQLSEKSVMPMTELSDVNECQLSNLISLNLLKGYLSHSHQCLVLSKKDPFP
ncbi:COP9 signalosome (CSN) subunit [Monosporozyma unispora]|nr:COP9 signalosome (CSN) subunit [Kazachstania unispora]